MKKQLCTFGSDCAKGKAPKQSRKLERLAVSFALTLITLNLLSISSSASIGNIVKSDLTGTWRIALSGNTGCGLVAMQTTATINSAGKGTASLITHGQCGDSSLSGQSFNINTLAANGSGTAGLTCGVGCGWTFNIQVSPDRSKFNLVDVSPANPNNYLSGVAVLSSPAGDIVTPDLTGSWEVSLYGVTGCGISDMAVTFTLNSSGLATDANSIGHSAGCGDGTGTGNTFQILSLNSDGSGTAGLTCGAGCGWTFNIQVSPDRSTISLVDVASFNPGNYLAGEAIRTSSVGNISKTNLAGPWQVTLVDSTGCNLGSLLVNFTLNASGVSTAATETGHTLGCGDGTSTGNTFTVQTLNPDGSGTANLTCGPSCGWNFKIQVSPDRSTFNLVDVSSANPGNFIAGKAVHR